MKTTVVVSPEVGRGMFPHPVVRHAPTPYYIRVSAPTFAPTITWLVAPEALVCPTCKGKGWTGNPGGGNYSVPWHCPDCHGTGRPDVTIVSESCIVIGREPDTSLLRTTHGVLVLGEGVPVVDVVVSPLRRKLRERTISYVVLVRGGPLQALYASSADNAITDITDAIGNQRIEPGYIAYPVKVKS